MTRNLFAPLLAGATRRWLASPLALWGKLPAHADYVNIGTPPADAQAWQAWVTQHWRAPHKQAEKARRPEQQGWLRLSPPPAEADLCQVPVAFSLRLPGPRLSGPALRGVIVASCDKVGRAHPLIVYQRLHERWLQREPAASAGQDLHYWLARLMLRWQQGHEELTALSRALQALNEAAAPGWPQLFGAAPQPVPPTLWQSLLAQLNDDDAQPDGAGGLKGKARLPSMNTGRSLFWQQDAHGGYLRSAGAWGELWKA